MNVDPFFVSCSSQSVLASFLNSTLKKMVMETIEFNEMLRTDFQESKKIDLHL